MNSSFYQRYFLAGLVFQSVLVGGGYATGRELIEFFMLAGPVSGLLGLIFAAMAFSLVSALAFEYARCTESYDYRIFFKHILGRAWVIFEAAFLLLVILVLAVIGAAAGEIAEKAFGITPIAGTSVFIIVIATVLFFGSRLLECFLSVWSFVLYGTFFILGCIVLCRHGAKINWSMENSLNIYEAGFGAIRYVGYSLAVLPAILFCVRHFETRRQALVSGMLAGPLAMLPAIFLYLTLLCFYPQITQESVPTYLIIQQLGMPLFAIMFYVVIYGTFIETGAGLIHSVNERIADTLMDSGIKLSSTVRALIGLSLMVMSIYLATTVGLIDLIAKGYGYSAYVFIILVGIPVMVYGGSMLARDISG